MSGYGRAVRFDNEGKATRMVGVMYDISEMKQKERLKDEFISVASHELKTPVTSIKAYAEIIQERLDEMGNTENSQLLSKLNAQIDRLNALIGNLLDSTKISEGQLQLRFEPVNINELLNDKIQEIKRTTNHKIELVTQDTPMVNADRERIGQVITNLLSNAVKYSPQGTSITISSRSGPDGVMVNVRDKGYGIPEADIGKVFDKFFRVTTNNMDTFPGMGLGLYVTEKIVRQHGGTVSVESIEGKGSVFSFWLPF